MSNNPPPEGATDDFFEHILANPSYYVNDTSSAVNNGNFPGTVSSTMGLQLSSGDEGGGGGGFQALGLRLEQSTNGFRQEGEPVQLTNLFPAFGHIQTHSIRPTAPQAFQSSHGQPTSGTVSNVTHPPMFRPRVRARRGQATDPHSIAERLRRERIAERMKALQELVPSFNKTDKAAMLDEVVDYVKFLRLQVKVLSMSRLGGAGAVAQLVTDVPLPSVEVEDGEDASNLTDKWSTKDAEQQVAKLMEKDVGSAMQFLQSKALCIMPISLAAAIYPIYQSEASALVKPELNTPS